MTSELDRKPGASTITAQLSVERAPSTPGKRSLTEQLTPDLRTRGPFPLGTGPAVQRKAGGASAADGATGTEGAEGAGAPLEAGLRRDMERSFDTDFSSVRVHEGPAAPALGARAFARGESIHVAPGQLDPASHGSRRLVGHELAHVVQQRAGRVHAPQAYGGLAVNDDAGLEAEADRAGDRAARGEPAGMTSQPAQSGGAAAAGPVQRDCDPSIASCPAPAAGDAGAAGGGPTGSVPPVGDYAPPAGLGLTLDVAGPPGLGGGGPPDLETLRLANPILHADRQDLYAVPVEYVFATPQAARGAPRGSGREGGAPGGTAGPHGPTAGPAPSAAGANPAPGPAPGTAAPGTAAPGTAAPGTAAPGAAAPGTAAPGAAASQFQPGQVVYTLDGPLTVVAASGSYVVTNVYTKFAVGAGSTTLVRTQAGYVLVDAGMHQVGGNINDVLADAIIERLARTLGAEPLEEVMLTHIHTDHTALLPRIYARWPIGTLRVNAMQAMVPGSRGAGTALDQLVHQMIEAQRAHVEAEVRRELTSAFGPWDLLVDPEAREAQLQAQVHARAQARMQAMRPTQVQLDIPSGGQVVAANVPLGRIATPAEVAIDGAPITGARDQPGMTTILDPRAGAATARVAGGQTPRGGEVDTQSSTYVIDLPSGNRLFVISDQRVDDVLRLQGQFEAQLARAGAPRHFQIFDMTHHLQVGFSGGTGVVRGRQLADLTQMLASYLDARDQQGHATGDALIVSVHGPGTGQGSYVDPANVWLLRSLGLGVFPATGGGSPLTAAQDVSVLQVELGDGRSTTGVAGAPYPGRAPSDYLLRRAGAAITQLDDRIANLRARLASRPSEDERAQFEQQLASATAERDRIRGALEAYTTAFHAELTRSPRGATANRPDVAPPAGGPEPAAAQAAALRALLVDYTAPVVGEVPHFTPEALVVAGQDRMAGADPATQALIAARDRVRTLAEGLRWSSPPERRNAVASALDAYRARVMAAMTAHSGSRDVLVTELARIDADLSRLTGLTPQQWQELRAAAELANRLAQRAAHPRPLTDPSQLTDGAIARQILSAHQGYALLAGQLYEVGLSGERVTTRRVALQPAFVPRSTGAVVVPPGAPPALPPPAAGRGNPGDGAEPRAPSSSGLGPIGVPGLLPPELAEHPSVLNISGRTIVFEGGGSIPPSPSSGPAAPAQPGELIVRGFSSGWFVVDPVTQRPIAAALHGGEMWRVEADGTLTLEVDAAGNVQAPGGVAITARGPLEAEQYGRRVPDPEADPAGGGGPGAGARVVAGGLGIVMLANEVLGPIARVQQSQQFNLDRRRAVLRMWIQFGANPTWEMRTQNAGETRPATTQPSISTFGDPTYHFITALDVPALGRNLDATLRTYQDLVLWLDMAAALSCVTMDPAMQREQSAASRARRRTYTAWIDGPAGARSGVAIDLTGVIEPIERRTLGELDQTMRQRVAGWSDAERAGIFRLRRGSETPLYRLSHDGHLHGSEPIASASAILGPDPQVRVLEHRGDRSLVEPANADAERSAQVSAYQINKPIADVLAEVQAAGRPVLSRWPATGPLQGFVAGPLAGDPRFGTTRYYPHQQEPQIWTVAIGQLNRFWVDRAELAPIGSGTANGQPPGSAAGPQGAP